MTDQPALVWFRRDLRTKDNPALSAALATGGPVVGLYILDDSPYFAPGAAQRWLLRHALAGLGDNLRRLGVPLALRRGRESSVLQEVVEEASAVSVWWNRRYAAEDVSRDREIKDALKARGVEAHSFNGLLLREPWEIATKSKTPFRVFSPFWRTLREAGPSRLEIAALKPAKCRPAAIDGDALDDWGLLPSSPKWAAEFPDRRRADETGACALLSEFLAGPLRQYGVDRDRPDVAGTSRLSAHLALGTISPLTIWNAVNVAIGTGAVLENEGRKFLSELAWREFAYHLLYYNSQMPTEPLRPEFSSFPWRDDDAAFTAWSRGRTGVPIVDAGMRELWRTGWMHNRVRMIAASFLVKNLLIPWQRGERWFWDALIDADPANNPASWQWVAGCGADAAPYFRIFNPVTQGEKFDPDGAYVRRFAPELRDLPSDFIHAPWRAPEDALRRAGVTLGRTYPLPIVDLDQTRRRALVSYAEMKAGAA